MRISNILWAVSLLGNYELKRQTRPFGLKRVSNTGFKQKVERSDTFLPLSSSHDHCFLGLILLKNGNRFCPLQSLLTNKPVSSPPFAGTDLKSLDLSFFLPPVCLCGACHCLPCMNPAWFEEPGFFQWSGWCCSWDGPSVVHWSCSGWSVWAEHGGMGLQHVGGPGVAGIMLGCHWGILGKPLWLLESSKLRWWDKAI